jgi:hypothetical protein
MAYRFTEGMALRLESPSIRADIRTLCNFGTDFCDHLDEGDQLLVYRTVHKAFRDAFLWRQDVRRLLVGFAMIARCHLLREYADVRELHDPTNREIDVAFARIYERAMENCEMRHVKRLLIKDRGGAQFIWNISKEAVETLQSLNETIRTVDDILAAKNRELAHPPHGPDATPCNREYGGFAYAALGAPVVFAVCISLSERIFSPETPDLPPGFVP